jgi:hypothetical protein
MGGLEEKHATSPTGMHIDFDGLNSQVIREVTSGSGQGWISSAIAYTVTLAPLL